MNTRTAVLDSPVRGPLSFRKTHHFRKIFRKYFFFNKSLLFSCGQCSLTFSKKLVFSVFIIFYRWIEKCQFSICLVIWQSFCGGVLLVVAGGQYLQRNVLRIIFPPTNKISEKTQGHKTGSTFSAGYFDPFGWGVNSRKQIQKEGYSLLFITCCEASRSISVYV